MCYIETAGRVCKAIKAPCGTSWNPTNPRQIPDPLEDNRSDGDGDEDGNGENRFPDWAFSESLICSYAF